MDTRYFGPWERPLQVPPGRCASRATPFQPTIRRAKTSSTNAVLTTPSPTARIRVRTVRAGDSRSQPPVHLATRTHEQKIAEGRAQLVVDVSPSCTDCQRFVSRWLQFARKQGSRPLDSLGESSKSWLRGRWEQRGAEGAVVAVDGGSNPAPATKRKGPLCLWPSGPQVLVAGAGFEPATFGL